MRHYTISLAIIFLLSGCMQGTARPSANEVPRVASYAIAYDQPSGLRRAILPHVKRHPGQTGIEFLPDGRTALDLRIALIKAAEKSIDLQYYMVEDDNTDQLLLLSLLEAADRGVRVRMLVDSFNFMETDPLWHVLNEHKNLQVRVFNPFVTRHQSLFSFVVNPFIGLPHYNRRMHNKVMITDNQAAITGGRNLGDPYFEAGEDFNFHDADVMAVGPAVPLLSQSFDNYWNNDESFPLAHVISKKVDAKLIQQWRDQLEMHRRKNAQSAKHVKPIPITRQLQRDDLKLIWTDVEVIADSPSKIDAPPSEATSKPAQRLVDLSEQAQSEFILVSSYFVPQEDGVKWLAGLAQRGVKVRILTNSLASTDVVSAGVGYKRYREDLLDAGIELYEMKPVVEANVKSESFKSNAPTSLHSKLYIIDRKVTMIGSFNFDPRSIRLNTEQVVVIHSPEMAKEVGHMFDESIAPQSSYRLKMVDGDLQWATEEKGQPMTYDSDPGVDFERRVKMFFLSLLPIEDQL